MMANITTVSFSFLRNWDNVTSLEKSPEMQTIQAVRRLDRSSNMVEPSVQPHIQTFFFGVENK